MEDTPKFDVPEDVKDQIHMIQRPLGWKFGIDGRRVVMGEGIPNTKEMHTWELPLEIAELGELPGGFTARHHHVMSVIYEAVSQIRKMTKRSIPLTRSELFKFGATAPEVSKLEKMGLVEEVLIQVVERETGKLSGQRAVILFTPRGRAYVRKAFNPKYGLEEGKDGGPGPQDSAPEPGGDPRPAVEDSGEVQS